MPRITRSKTHCTGIIERGELNAQKTGAGQTSAWAITRADLDRLNPQLAKKKTADK